MPPPTRAKPLRRGPQSGAELGVSTSHRSGPATVGHGRVDPDGHQQALVPAPVGPSTACQTRSAPNRRFLSPDSVRPVGHLWRATAQVAAWTGVAVLGTLIGFQLTSKSFPWWLFLISAAASIAGFLITSRLSRSALDPAILDGRRNSIARWRAMVNQYRPSGPGATSAEIIPHPVLFQPDFASLRPHLKRKAVQRMEHDPHGRGQRVRGSVVRLLDDEIARIERRWGLP